MFMQNTKSALRREKKKQVCKECEQRFVSGDLTHLDVAFLAKAILANFTEECCRKNKKHTKTNYRLYQNCKCFPIYDSNKDTELVQVHYAEVKATKWHWSTEKFTSLQVIMPDSFKLSRK